MPQGLGSCFSGLPCNTRYLSWRRDGKECIHNSWRFRAFDLQGADPLPVSGPHVAAPIKYGLSEREMNMPTNHPTRSSAFAGVVWRWHAISSPHQWGTVVLGLYLKSSVVVDPELAPDLAPESTWSWETKMWRVCPQISIDVSRDLYHFDGSATSNGRLQECGCLSKRFRTQDPSSPAAVQGQTCKL